MGGPILSLPLLLHTISTFRSVNLSLIIWSVCGIFTMFGAYCYAELGCMIKKSGADYAYIHVTFGPLAAFVRLWIECIIVRPCTGAIQSLTFALYISKPLFPECDPPESSLRMLAAGSNPVPPPGNAHLNSEEGSIIMADLLVLTGLD